MATERVHMQEIDDATGKYDDQITVARDQHTLDPVRRLVGLGEINSLEPNDAQVFFSTVWAEPP